VFLEPTVYLGNLAPRSARRASCATAS
jgi:hypothetical protein